MQYTFLARISDAFETSVVKPKPDRKSEQDNYYKEHNRVL